MSVAISMVLYAISVSWFSSKWFWYIIGFLSPRRIAFLRAMSLTSSGYPHASVIRLHFSMYSVNFMSPCVNTLYWVAATSLVPLGLQCSSNFPRCFSHSWDQLHKPRLVENILASLSWQQVNIYECKFWICFSHKTKTFFFYSKKRSCSFPSPVQSRIGPFVSTSIAIKSRSRR